MTIILRTNTTDVEVQAMLFDKDGTLLDFVSLWGTWSEVLIAQVVARANMMNKEAEMLAAILGVRIDSSGKVTDYETAGLLSTGTIDGLKAAVMQYCYVAGIDQKRAQVIADESMAEAYRVIEQTRPVQPLMDIREVLEQCYKHNILLAVVTADETADAVKHLEWLGLKQYFQFIIGNDQVASGKPHPDLVHLACQRLGVKPANVAVVGDTEGDMVMGKRANVAVTVAIAPRQRQSGLRRKQLAEYRHADVVVTSYSELLDKMIYCENISI